MYCASSFTPKGAGDNFFRFSIACSAIPFFGPSFAGRSNISTGTLALIRCAAICAPITPAPSTATLRMIRLLTGYSDRAGSEQCGCEIEQRLHAGARGAYVKGRFGQQFREIEPPRREIRLVE